MIFGFIYELLKNIYNIYFLYLNRFCSIDKKNVTSDSFDFNLLKLLKYLDFLEDLICYNVFQVFLISAAAVLADDVSM